MEPGLYVERPKPQALPTSFLMTLLESSRQAKRAGWTCFATSWESAHVLERTLQRCGGAYFIQDYEPLFYTRGWLNILARHSFWSTFASCH